LQVLNGNYHIPEQPKYSIAVTGLIKNMLEASPNARPDITQARALID
jgi:AP2-associated kinase